MATPTPQASGTSPLGKAQQAASDALGQLDWKLQTMLQIRISMFLPLVAELASAMQEFKHAPIVPLIGPLPKGYYDPKGQTGHPAAAPINQKSASSTPSVAKAEATTVKPVSEKAATQPLQAEDHTTAEPSTTVEPKQTPTISASSQTIKEVPSTPSEKLTPRSTQVPVEPIDLEAKPDTKSTPKPQQPVAKAVIEPIAQPVPVARAANPSLMNDAPEDMDSLRKSLLDMINSQISGKAPGPDTPEGTSTPAAVVEKNKALSALAEVALIQDTPEKGVANLRERLSQFNEAEKAPAVPVKNVQEAKQNFSGEKSLQRFVAPEFDPKSPTLRAKDTVDEKPAEAFAVADRQASSVTDQAEAVSQSQVQTEQQSPALGPQHLDLQATQPVPEVSQQVAQQEPEGQHFEGASALRRFQQPEFDAKPPTLHLERPAKDAGAALEPAAQAQPPAKAVESSQVQPQASSERITSDSMRRFKDLEGGSAAVAQPEPAQQLKAAKPTAGESSMTTESFRRFINPSFEQKRLRTYHEGEEVQQKETGQVPSSASVAASPYPATLYPQQDPGTTLQLTEKVFEYQHAGVRLAIVIKPDQLKYFTQDPTILFAQSLEEENKITRVTATTPQDDTSITESVAKDLPLKDVFEGIGDRELDRMRQLLGEDTLSQLRNSFSESVPQQASPEEGGVSRARELLQKLTNEMPLESKEGQSLELINETDQLDLGSQALNDDFMKRINNFQRNLDRLRAKPLPSPTEITLKTIQQKFLNQMVQSMSSTATAGFSTTSTSLHPSPEVGLGIAVAEEHQPTSIQGQQPNSVDETLERFKRFEPVISSNLNSFRENTHTLPDLQIEEHDAEGAHRAEFVSETLAQIHVLQGHPAKAVRIYEQLILKQPEKSAYFESQIAKLSSS